MARSKVKSRSHHDVAHLHPLTNVPTMYQLPIPYGFWEQAGQTSFRRPPTHPDTAGENNTPTALKGCGEKMNSSCGFKSSSSGKVRASTHLIQCQDTDLNQLPQRQEVTALLVRNTVTSLIK